MEGKPEGLTQADSGAIHHARQASGGDTRMRLATPRAGCCRAEALAGTLAAVLGAQALGAVPSGPLPWVRRASVRRTGVLVAGGLRTGYANAPDHPVR